MSTKIFETGSSGSWLQANAMCGPAGVQLVQITVEKQGYAQLGRDDVLALAAALREWAEKITPILPPCAVTEGCLLSGDHQHMHRCIVPAEQR